MHALFERQLKKCLRSDGSVDLEKLGSAVSAAYDEAEKGRRLLDRSMALVSEEMMELNNILRERAAEISAIIHSVHDAIFVTNPYGTILSLNAPAETIFEYTSSEMVGQPLSLLLPDFNFMPLSKDGVFDGESVENYFAKAIETDAKKAFRKEFPVEFFMKPIHVNGRTSFVAIIRDITVRKIHEQRLYEAAFYDQLTGLPNRALFLDRLQETIRKSKRLDKGHAAILFIDLDRFKIINDSLGHEAGDELLRQVAFRFQRVMRPYDTVARMGGDEFTVLITEMPEPDYAQHVANRHLEELKKPFNLMGREVYVTASIGISLISDNDELSDEVLRNADLAMYQAKNSGRARCEFYHEDQHTSMLTRMEMEQALREALGNKEIEVYYQPIIHLKSGKIMGFESLLRWFHPEHGSIPPSQFIPLAEEAGLIKSLGTYVLEKSCQQIKTWHMGNLKEHELYVSVNLSPNQILDDQAVADILSLIKKAKLPQNSLKIECTETVLMKDPERVGVFFRHLKEEGVQLCIDDFGTGYSALEYVHKFPFDVLKIDRRFIESMTQEEKDLRLVAGIISLAHSLGLKVVAEGVERDEEIQHLLTLDADYVQGYFFSKPLNVLEASSLVATGASFPAHYLPKIKRHKNKQAV